MMVIHNIDILLIFPARLMNENICIRYNVMFFYKVEAYLARNVPTSSVIKL